ncbi:MAG: ion transporter [Leptospiraceae bacterium]|nr:ion transporter [Leptospiraceae bacterium]
MRTLWDLLLFLVTLTLAILGPLEIVYRIKGPIFVFYSGVFLTAIFLIDMFLSFRTAYYDRGELIEDLAQIRRHYLRRWFVIDFISLFPFDLISGPIVVNVAGKTIDIAPILRLVRLVRLLHLRELVNRWRHADFLNPSMMRLGILVLWMLMMAHWAACGWIVLGNIKPEYNAAENYLRAFYWVITTFATIGYGDITPLNIPQIAYTVVIEIIGVGMFGYMIGNIASLLANLDIARSKYQEKINRLNLYLEYRDIPIALRQKLRHYYRYMWESRRGYDENLILKDLPSALQKELAMHIHAEVIEKVPIFKGASDAFIKEIVMKLSPAMFTPGDYIFREGEVGHNMYFISRGSVEILSEKSNQVYATIGEGGYFGEIALLMAQPRNASVRAVEYCDLYTLDKNSFQVVLSEFPQFAQQVKKMARERMHHEPKKSAQRGRRGR